MALLKDYLLEHKALEGGSEMKTLEAIECKCGQIISLKLDVGEEKRVVCPKCDHAMVVRVEEDKAA